MTRVVILLSLLTGVFSCSQRKILPSEEYLTPHSSSEKIYIVSVLPKSSDTSATFISSLLITTRQSNKTQAVLLNQTMQGEFVSSGVNYFSDSIEQLDETQFPIFIHSSADDSLHDQLSFSLDRKQIDLTASSWKNKFGYRLGYEKSTFGSDSFAGKSDIHGLSIPVQVKELNGLPMHQESTLLLNVFNNPADLYLVNSNSTNYWLDFQLFSGETYSIYFRNEHFFGISILNSNYLPNSSIESTIDYKTLVETMTLSTENEIALTMIRKLGKSSGKFSIETVPIKKGEEIVGNGILYTL